MHNSRHIPTRAILLAVLCVLLAQSQAQAYIGPGAGFAVGTTVFAFFVAFLSAVAAIFLWPMRWLFRFFRGRRARARARVKRFVILGLDGMEPTLTDKFLAEGKLPNLAKLAQEAGKPESDLRAELNSLGKSQIEPPQIFPLCWTTAERKKGRGRPLYRILLSDLALWALFEQGEGPLRTRKMKRPTVQVIVEAHSGGMFVCTHEAWELVRTDLNLEDYGL